MKMRKSQVKEVSRKVAENAEAAEQDVKGMKRRGFFAAIAATVVGVVGIGKTHVISVPHQQVLKDDKPVVSIHPDAIARTEEGSRRHG